MKKLSRIQKKVQQNHDTTMDVLNEFDNIQELLNAYFEAKYGLKDYGYEVPLQLIGDLLELEDVVRTEL